MLNSRFLAFALLHISVPAISILFWGGNPLWLVGSLLFATAMFRTLQEKRSAGLVTSLCLLSGLAFFLTLLLGTSYYMSGEGFNDSFFYHLNSGSLVIASRSYAAIFYPSLVGLILALLAPAVISRTQHDSLLPAAPLWLLWVLAVIGNYPAYSMVSYQVGWESELPGAASEGIAPAVGSRPAETVDTQDVLPSSDPRDVLQKNIILIYAESLEELYFDTDIFGELLPNIRELSTKAHRFTNLRQVAGTGWTIAGIVASQCGFPVKVSNHLASNSTMASIEKPYEDETCLADILSENGYQTTYMGGAPLWFAGKENFLRTHGYKNIMGDEQLLPLLENRQYQSGWGIYDDSLFELALDELEKLENESSPYLLTLLTLDTHHPDGIPSRSCKKLNKNSDAMSNAIYCSDQLIGQFIREAMNRVDMEDTIIVLFSDHLSLRNTLWSKLKDNRKRRRLSFMIFDDAPPSVSHVSGTHFDVAPTILDAAGLTAYPRVGAGTSLFERTTGSGDSSKPKPGKIAAPSLIREQASIQDDGVALFRKDLALKVGDLTLKANHHGQKFVSGMYLAVFNEQGHVVDAIFSENFPVLAKTLEGTFVVGISVQRAPPYSAMYFYGRLSPDGKDMTQHDFNYDVHLKADEIWTSRSDG